MAYRGLSAPAADCDFLPKSRQMPDMGLPRSLRLHRCTQANKMCTTFNAVDNAPFSLRTKVSKSVFNTRDNNFRTSLLNVAAIFCRFCCAGCRRVFRPLPSLARPLQGRQ